MEKNGCEYGVGCLNGGMGFVVVKNGDEVRAAG